MSFHLRTTKLTGGNGAQRNCRPVERLDNSYGLPSDEGVTNELTKFQ
jgi:hypothetical protein